MSMAIVAGVGIAVSAGVGIYEANQQAGIANSQIGLANDVNGRQAYSFNQLQQLIQSPDTFFNSPVYQAAFGQGTQAVARSEAAGGFLNSGKAATELQQFGQSFGQQQLLQQEQLLAGLSGATSSTSPGQALAGASASNSAAAGQFGGVLASLGFASGNYGAGGFSGGYGSAGDPAWGGTMPAGGGYTWNTPD